MGYGAATVSLPFVAGCGRTEIQRLTSKSPSLQEPGKDSGAVSVSHFDAFGVDEGLIRKVLSRALSRGASFSEIFLQHRVSHWVGMEDGEVNRAYSEVGLGAGIRVIQGDTTGFSFTEDLTPGALLEAADMASAVADGPSSPRSITLTPRIVVSRYTVETPWTEVGIDRKLPIVQRAEKAARNHDTRIIKVTVALQDETSHILIANSEGLLVADERPMGVLSVSCVGENKGKTETGYWTFAQRDGIRFLTPAHIDDTGTTAARNTVLLFEAVSPPVGDMPVVLGPGNPGLLLHEAIGHGMEADFNRKGISIYANRIGKRIAPEGVTIVDGGTGRQRGSLNIDDEGHPTEETVLVENGVLRTYLHDRISAQHFKAPRTGSGRRESYCYPPVPRMRNTYMLAGKESPEEIIASVKKGIYAEIFTNGQVMIGAGDFTFYLKHGRLIEDGKLTHVIKDANLIGNGPNVLEKVAMIGNDLKHITGAGYCGKDGQGVPVGFGLPTLKVSGISVGGRGA